MRTRRSRPGIRESEYRGSGCVWTCLPISLPKYDHAPAIARMIKTKKSENVRVLVIYLRPQQFEKK